VAQSLLGLFRWCTDFVVYLLQELFDTSFKVRGKEDDRSYLQKHRKFPQSENTYTTLDDQLMDHLVNTSNSPGLIITLASFTRAQLRMLCRPLGSGHVFAHNGMKAAVSTEQRNTFYHLIQVFSKTPLQIKALEQYIGEVDVLVRNAYTKAGMNDQQRRAAERDLFWRCEIPEVLMPAVKEMLTGKLRKLMEVSDPGKVHNHDIRSLNLTDDKRTKQMHERLNIDVIRKVPLGGQVRLRRCPRCLSVMEDLTPQQLAALPAWVYQNQRNCVCFSSWIVMDSPEA
jgi:mediator of RNA polymerase II transcription subunit 16